MAKRYRIHVSVSVSDDTPDDPMRGYTRVGWTDDVGYEVPRMSDLAPLLQKIEHVCDEFKRSLSEPL